MTVKTSVPQAAAGAGAPTMPRGRRAIEAKARRTRELRFIRILLGGVGLVTEAGRTAAFPASSRRTLGLVDSFVRRARSVTARVAIAWPGSVRRAAGRGIPWIMPELPEVEHAARTLR